MLPPRLSLERGAMRGGQTIFQQSRPLSNHTHTSTVIRGPQAVTSDDHPVAQVDTERAQRTMTSRLANLDVVPHHHKMVDTGRLRRREARPVVLSVAGCRVVLLGVLLSSPFATA
jgi:hypothetical protein